jgi:hypothetical protein
MQPLNIDISQRAQGPASHIEIVDLMQLTELCFIYNLEVGHIFKPVCDMCHFPFGELLSFIVQKPALNCNLFQEIKGMHL